MCNKIYWEGIQGINVSKNSVVVYSHVYCIRCTYSILKILNRFKVLDSYIVISSSIVYTISSTISGYVESRTINNNMICTYSKASPACRDILSQISAAAYSSACRDSN